MIKIAICDDEENETQELQRLLLQYSVARDMDFEIDCFMTGTDLLSNYEKGKYTIVFLDIEMADTSGLDIAEAIRRLPDHDVNIVFETNYPDYMIHSFNVRAAQFFSKPINYDVFCERMDQIFDYMKYEDDRKIIIDRGKEKIILNLADVVTIEAVQLLRSNSNIVITSISGDYKMKGKLRDFEATYKDVFVFANRSVLVNVRHICKFCGNKLYLTCGKKIDVSRGRILEIKEKFTSMALKEVKKWQM